MWKAKAKLRRVSQEIVNERLQTLRKQQETVALSVQEKLRVVLKTTGAQDTDRSTPLAYDSRFDPEPSLKLRAEDKNLRQVEEKEFIEDTVRCVNAQSYKSPLIALGYGAAKNYQTWLCTAAK